MLSTFRQKDAWFGKNAYAPASFLPNPAWRGSKWRQATKVTFVAWRNFCVHDGVGGKQAGQGRKSHESGICLPKGLRPDFGPVRHFNSRMRHKKIANTSYFLVSPPLFLHSKNCSRCCCARIRQYFCRKRDFYWRIHLLCLVLWMRAV